MAAGMNEHLAKPLEEDKVVRAIYENIVKKEGIKYGTTHTACEISDKTK